MKISILVLGLLAVACRPQFRYSVEGRISNYEGRILFVTADETGKWDTLGNMLSADGTFAFTGEVTQPRVGEVVAVNASLRIPVFLEKGDFQVKADAENMSDYTVDGGGSLQNLRRAFAEKEAEIRRIRDSSRREYERMYGKNDYFSILQIKGMLQRVDSMYDRIEDDFIRRNDNLVSADLVYRRMKTLRREKRLHRKYALLGEEARNSVEGRWLRPYVEKEKRIVVGGTAPDLTMETPEGENMSLYGIKAKVKVLDFWASWCGPCRAENPNVRKVYDLYKAKGLEVISISLDVKRDAWKKAIEEDSLPWIHLSDLKGWNSFAADLYEIDGIPHLFVLDENNRIIAENLRGEELGVCVAEVLRGE